MPYNIKRVRATLLKKKNLIWGFCTKMDNGEKTLGFQVLYGFFL